MKLLAVCSLLLSALCLRAELAFKWTVEVSQPLPYAAEALQGETFNLEAKVVQYRVPMLEAAEATFYYQTPEMEASQWYTVPAAWEATTATASVAFTPAMDVGSTKYRFFFGIETEQGKNYRVFGTLRLKASPGFSPATLEPTDVRAEMIQEILEAVFEESDERYATKAEHAALAVQVQGKAPASHTHADLQQSATVLLQAINSESESREEADAALGEQLGALGAELEGKADVAHTHDCSDVEGLQTVLDAKQDKLTIDYALSTTSTNPVQNKAVKAELDKKLALTGGTVTGETLFRGGIRTDSFKTLYGTPLLETVSSKGFKFTGLYQFVPYQQTKPFFTAESGTTTLDVTTAKATSFVEDGTALSAKYATKSELAAVPTVSQDMSGMSIGSSNGKSSFYFLSDGGVIFSTTSKGDTRSATLVGQAALAGKADAQHTHAFEEMAVTVSGASYRWQWDETEGTFALVAE
ncbi:MAG: hypothetical protein IJV69_07930 [Kiritimatiellae bacterium]|nr:hypothetical protein [Kiritimatiellia bacterium]